MDCANQTMPPADSRCLHGVYNKLSKTTVNTRPSISLDACNGSLAFQADLLSYCNYVHNKLLVPIAEIVEFCRFLEPTAREATMREAATERVRQAIVEVFPTASVQVFGSFVTGMSTSPALSAHTLGSNLVSAVVVQIAIRK